MKNDESKGLSWPLSLLVTLLICVLAYTAASLLTREKSHILSDTTVLPCTSSQAVQVLGKGVVYSDGTSLRALNDRGRQTWSYVVGANCGFNACESGVAAWSGDLLAVLNPENGAALFSGSLGQTILSATVGSSYAAALVGEESSATLIVLELSGREIDRIALEDITVLDYGFFNKGEMLWVMSLDTNGTIPMSQVTTYKPGRKQSGKITDSEQIIYEVMFESPNVYAVGTTYVRVYDYTGVENVGQRRLVYGWYLVDSDTSADGALMAFVPMAEIGTTAEINDVRLVKGNTDRTIRMPFTCFSILARGNAVYGFSDQYVMIHSLNAEQAETYQLPFQCDALIGVTSSSSAVLVSGDSVYMVPLP